MSKSLTTAKDLPKAKIVIITGPKVDMPPEILQFKSNPEVIFVGDGTQRVTIKNIEKALEGYDKTDVSFYLRTHGIRKDYTKAGVAHKKHYIALGSEKPKLTETFFKEMHKVFGDTLTVDATACYGAVANNVAKALGSNSALTTHVPSKHAASSAQSDFEISKSIEDHLNDAPFIERVRNTLLRSQPFTIVPVLNDASGNTIKFKAPRITKEEILKPLTKHLGDNTKTTESIVNNLINKNIEDFKKNQNYDKTIEWVKERYGKQEADELKNFKMNASKGEAEGYLYGTLNYLIANSGKMNKESILDLIDVYCDRGLSVNKHEHLPGTLLYKAVIARDSEIITKLLDRGAEINAPGIYETSSVLTALDNGYSDIVKLLLEKGADINSAKKDGTTPLLIAVNNNDLDTARYLLDKGADVNIPNKDGTTPLLLAIGYGYLDIVKILLDKKVDVNKPEKDGTTPLLLATNINHLDIVKLLLEKGADPAIKNKDGKTVLDHAKTYSSKEIVKVLEQAQKKQSLQGEVKSWQERVGRQELNKNTITKKNEGSSSLTSFSTKQASSDKNLRRL